MLAFAPPPGLPMRMSPPSSATGTKQCPARISDSFGAWNFEENLHPVAIGHQFSRRTEARTGVCMAGDNEEEGASVDGGGEKNLFAKRKRGKILILGGSGFLGRTVARRAVLEGYDVTSLSRRGAPPKPSRSPRRTGKGGDRGTNEAMGPLLGVDYRVGDATDKDIIDDILSEGGYTGIVHCIGILFDSSTRLNRFNRLVSGSNSSPDAGSTYDDVNRISAFNAIDATIEYNKANSSSDDPLPFVFVSAAEAGWSEVPGGGIAERLSPGWFRRYLSAKRAVEGRLLTSSVDGRMLRPIIFRPSLIYSLDRVGGLAPAGALYAGSAAGLPFVDRPVNVQALSCAMVRSLGDPNVRGILRFAEIDELSQ